MGKLGHPLLFALVFVIFIIPTANAAWVTIYIDDSEDLLTTEGQVTIDYGKEFILTIQISDVLRLDSGNANFSVASMSVDLYFLSETDPRDPCILCSIPFHQPLSDTDKDLGYDTFQARFNPNTVEALEGYNGNVRFNITMKNMSGGQVWTEESDVTITAPSSGERGSSGISIPELPPIINDNLLIIGLGLLIIIILSVGIYTLILAPEDTTAELYKERESIDPLKKSLTGVGYESDLPSEENEEEDDDYDKSGGLLDDDEDEEDFDESKLLAELTGPQKLRSEDEEEEPEPPKAKPKKAVKKRIVRKSVAKKVVRKAAPSKDTPKEPEINMGAGIISITCPACEKIHNVDDDTVKFICGCGRRIRLS